MNVVYERCCGLDVHKKMLVACLIVLGADGQRQKEVRSFSTMLADLLALREWLTAAGCTHVAMESTGVYWKPIYNVLDGYVEVLVVNAQHLKAVPGRKTDVHDAEWLADLLQHGLLRASYIPARAQRELRELTRTRTRLIQQRSQTINRLQKVLEDSNIKLASVVSDSMGMSAQAMLKALLEGQTDPRLLADLAQGRLRAKREQLEQALVGSFQPHHRFLIQEHLAHIDYLDEAIARLSQEIAEQLRPFDSLLGLLDTIVGINRRLAEVLLAEIGTDVKRFPTAKHLASWAGMCPGNDQSAGKRLSGRTRKGDRWLRAALMEAAHAAAHTKNTYLSAQYQRLGSRRGKQKAVVALAHSILVIIYVVMSRQEEYKELGGNYFDERDRQAVEKRLVRRLEQLGYQVSLHPNTPAA
jgi:transposase